MQGKLCHPGNECESPPEFVFIAFDGKIVEEHGKKKVSQNDITDIFSYLRIVLNIFHLGKLTQSHIRNDYASEIMTLIMHGCDKVDH